MNKIWIEKARTEFKGGHSGLDAPLENLTSLANEALQVEPYSVIDKPAQPGTSPHDYVSLATYYWPNPERPDGLPYVRRDGRENPELKQYDLPKLEGLIKDVVTLAIVAVFKDAEEYAAKAVQLLRAWFVDPRTRMRPHLKRGQFIPGHGKKGRNFAIIETRALANELVPAVELLHEHGWIESEDYGSLQAWFASYLRWLRWSRFGRVERGQVNNHGTSHFVQEAAFAKFVGRRNLSRRILTRARESLISRQIDPSGKQPHELKRNISMSYSCFNLSLFFDLADIGGELGVDYWGYQTEDGRGLRLALDWLIPFWTREQPWRYEQIKDYPWQRIFHLLRRAALGFADKGYEDLISKVPFPPIEERTRDKVNLLYPSPRGDMRVDLRGRGS